MHLFLIPVPTCPGRTRLSTLAPRRTLLPGSRPTPRSSWKPWTGVWRQTGQRLVTKDKEVVTNRGQKKTEQRWNKSRAKAGIKEDIFYIDLSMQISRVKKLIFRLNRPFRADSEWGSLPMFECKHKVVNLKSLLSLFLILYYFHSISFVQLYCQDWGWGHIFSTMDILHSKSSYYVRPFPLLYFFFFSNFIKS